MRYSGTELSAGVLTLYIKFRVNHAIIKHLYTRGKILICIYDQVKNVLMVYTLENRAGIET